MFDKLYANIGGKIKWLAKALFVLGTVVSVLTALACFLFGNAMKGLIGAGLFQKSVVFYGITVLILGPIASFVATWLLYAFGQLVENTEYLRHGALVSSDSSATEKSPVRYSVMAGGVVLNDRSTEHIVIPRSCGDIVVTKIGRDGFFEAKKLVSVTFPKTIEKIGDGAFCGCVNLKEIRYEGTLDDWNRIRKGEDWDTYTGDYEITFCAAYEN